MSSDSSRDLPPGRLLITADQVITPDAVHEPGWLLTDGPVIHAVDAGQPSAGTPHADRLHAPLVTPGLVDMHVHGAGGGDMTGGRPDDLYKATRELLNAGVTTALVSLVTASLPDLERVLDGVVAWTRQQESTAATRLAGIHLEGPFISPHYMGAHDPKTLAQPDRLAIRRLLDAGRGLIRMVTLAPELPGAFEAIDELRSAGVTVAAGHTGADHNTTRHAIEAGVSVATHLFNGMPRPHHRRPGPAMTLLDDTRVIVELINDEVHVHPAVARTVARVAGDNRLALISDAVAATAAPEGTYRLGNVLIRSQDGRVQTVDGSSLGGGNATLDRCLNSAVTTLGMPLQAAVRAATSTPARAIGEHQHAGHLRPGRTADLVLWNQDLTVRAVIIAGHLVRPGARP